MLMEIAYAKNLSLYGYRKILAVKEQGWEWSKKELSSPVFGIITVFLNEQQIKDCSYNIYCVNDNETGIDSTPFKYRIPEITPKVWGE